MPSGPDFRLPDNTKHEEHVQKKEQATFTIPWARRRAAPPNITWVASRHRHPDVVVDGDLELDDFALGSRVE
jgi:hypothetical protein